MKAAALPEAASLFHHVPAFNGVVFAARSLRIQLIFGTA